MRRRFFWMLIASILLTIVLIYMLSEYIDFFSKITSFITFTVDSVKDYLGWLGTAIGFLIYIKNRFLDTGMFRKIQKSYGKQRFIVALRVMLELLDVYNPEIVIQKISQISNTQTEMRRAMVELNEILITVGETTQENVIILSNRERRLLTREINKLLELIDKKFDIHYTTKNIMSKTDKAVAVLEKTLEKSKIKRESLFKRKKQKDKETNDKLRKNLNN